jgi:glutaredoxin
MSPRLFTALVLLACALNARAESLYRWVDAQGVVHYSDVAPPAPVKAEQRKISANVIQTSEVDYATQMAVKNFPVSLYTAPDCKDPCAEARALLQKRGVPFQEVSVKDEQSAAQLKKDFGTLEVPVLKVGKDVQHGFEPGAFNSSLDAAGYPADGRRLPGHNPQPAKAPEHRKDQADAK